MARAKKASKQSRRVTAIHCANKISASIRRNEAIGFVVAIIKANGSSEFTWFLPDDQHYERLVGTSELLNQNVTWYVGGQQLRVNILSRPVKGRTK